MNWYKSAIDLGWQDKGLYHFLNIMKLEIDSFPSLSYDNSRGSVGSNNINFKILKDDGTTYNLAIRMNANNIEVSIIAAPMRNIDFKSYDAYQVEPQQIIRDSLVSIDNDYNGEFENGMV